MSNPKPLTPKEIEEATKSIFGIVQALVVKNRWDRVVARAGWTIDMVFHEGDTLGVRERAWKVFDLFCEVVDPARMVFWWGGMPVPLTSKIAQGKLEKLRHRSTEDPKARAMMFNMASGNPRPPEVWENNAQEYKFECRIGNDDDIWQHERFTDPGIGPGMSYIRIALPVSWMLSQPPERNAGWFSTRVVELMQPYWSTAGWGIVPAVEERNIGNSGYGRQALYPYLQRFPGLNAIGGLNLMGQRFNHAMYSVNWLNFISDALLDRMGGREEVRRQVQASKYLSAGDVGNGLGIRAGDFFALGDTERGIGLPAFGEAARLLKPIRVKESKNIFIGPPPSGGGDENEDVWRLACDAYLSRFDLY